MAIIYFGLKPTGDRRQEVSTELRRKGIELIKSSPGMMSMSMLAMYLFPAWAVFILCLPVLIYSMASSSDDVPITSTSYFSSSLIHPDRLPFDLPAMCLRIRKDSGSIDTIRSLTGLGFTTQHIRGLEYYVHPSPPKSAYQLIGSSSYIEDVNWTPMGYVHKKAMLDCVEIIQLVSFCMSAIYRPWWPTSVTASSSFELRETKPEG